MLLDVGRSGTATSRRHPKHCIGLERPRIILKHIWYKHSKPFNTFTSVSHLPVPLNSSVTVRWLSLFGHMAMNSYGFALWSFPQMGLWFHNACHFFWSSVLHKMTPNCSSLLNNKDNSINLLVYSCTLQIKTRY